MKRLNIFIDESGDYGFNVDSSNIFVVSFVIHESNHSILEEVKYLNNKLQKVKYDGMIHLSNLIRKREEFSQFNLLERKSIFWSIFFFTQKINAKMYSVIIKKDYINSKTQLKEYQTQLISKFVLEINKYLKQFNKIIIYYDLGQSNLAKVLKSIFNEFTQVEFKSEFDHKEKKLFQVADFLTYIDKLIYKYNNRMKLTKDEAYFFNDKEIRKIQKVLQNKRKLFF